jgi:hypothetical protein
MADNIKQTFIEAFRLTPEGITGFLTTPIPTPPTIATPTDVDAAVLANGICAKYILDLFLPFAGLTPVELCLRIGQHNSVLQAGLLAGLQYIDATQTQKDIKILSPAAGATLLPGDVRLQAKASNGIMTQCAAEIDATPYPLDESNGVFEGYATIKEDGTYTATFYGIFGDAQEQKTASVSFTIDAEDEEAQPPIGTDKDAISKAQSGFDKAVGDLLYAIAENSPVGVVMDKWDLVVAAFNALKSVAELAGAGAQAILTEAWTKLQAVGTAIESGVEGAYDNATEFLGDAVAKVKNAVHQFLDKIL